LIEFRELAAFCEVAKQLSFHQAAARLGYVQSTVSAQVQSLEKELGVRLFDRLGRSIVLTTAGEALLPHAQELLEMSNRARAAATGVAMDGDVVGTISVSAPESLLTYRLPGVLRRFRELHAQVSIDLHPTPVGRFRGETRRALADGTVQLALVLDTPLQIHGFESEILCREEVSVVAPPDHRLVSAPARPSDLDGEIVLLPEAPDSGCAYRSQFQHQLAESQVTAETLLEFASIETVKQCVISGIGISALLDVAIEAEIESGRLARLDWSEPFQVYTQMVRNSRRSISPALAAFMTTIRQTLDYEK
jgi:DNA-binding transcriptional LysR family regulator